MDAMTAKQAQLNSLTNNYNNNDNKFVSIQANYQIETNNRNKERELDNRIECKKIINSIYEMKKNRDPNGSVWDLRLYNNTFSFVEENK